MRRCAGITLLVFCLLVLWTKRLGIAQDAPENSMWLTVKKLHDVGLKAPDATLNDLYNRQFARLTHRELTVARIKS